MKRRKESILKIENNQFVSVWRIVPVRQRLGYYFGLDEDKVQQRTRHILATCVGYVLYRNRTRFRARYEDEFYAVLYAVKV
jgi:hypothetical protein